MVSLFTGIQTLLPSLNLSCRSYAGSDYYVNNITIMGILAIVFWEISLFVVIFHRNGKLADTGILDRPASLCLLKKLKSIRKVKFPLAKAYGTVV